jgi:hypothetical protein
VVLKTAKLDGDRLTFDVDVLEGDLSGGDGPAALFIDRFGLSRWWLPRERAWVASTLRASAGGYARVGGVGAAGVWRRPLLAWPTKIVTAKVVMLGLEGGASAGQ